MNSSKPKLWKFESADDRKTSLLALNKWKREHPAHGISPGWEENSLDIFVEKFDGKEYAVVRRRVPDVQERLKGKDDQVDVYEIVTVPKIVQKRQPRRVTSPPDEFVRKALRRQQKERENSFDDLYDDPAAA